MRKNPIVFGTLIALFATLFYNSKVFAGDIEWSGVYRIEGNDIVNPEMRAGSKNGGPGKREQAYGLSHLVLRPKIVAGDGLTIYGQFDIFNNPTEANSQMGSVFGDGVGGPIPNSGASASPNSSNVLARTQKAETLEVSELYLTYTHEFGQLIAGRAPLQFGLGMTYNSGRGLFDHWYDTRDMVGYKLVMGNMYFLPMIGKPGEREIGQNDDVTDYMIQAEYDNPETDLQMGVFFSLRTGGEQSSDIPIYNVATEMGGVGATNQTKVTTKTVNVYVLRDTERFRAGVEASFQSGDNGLMTADSEKVAWGGFGIAGEFEYRPESSHWRWGLKAGHASGDDPTTANKAEGYAFNRNYDVAMLLFNRTLGQEDFFRTRAMLTGDAHDANGNVTRADIEAISNVTYLAPNATVAFSDKWSLNNAIITGWLESNPVAGKTLSKEIGYEWDATLTFSPRKGVAWVNQFGLLLPGSMWKESSGTEDHDNRIVYGFATKAAISF